MTSKVGHDNNLVTISTNANVIEEIQLVNEFIERVDYRNNRSRYKYEVLLREDILQ
ncbi:hypothetical protein KHA80_12795 [Anaerobacillus sp. HL2]|nr:hypothetical protein KHA80_12795 [Anaerobacillus sp. HL2]